MLTNLSAAVMIVNFKIANKESKRKNKFNMPKKAKKQGKSLKIAKVMRKMT